MEICSSGHDEICFEGKKCPLCEVIEEKDALLDRIEDLEKEIKAWEKSQ